jgi:O-antigen/teichoic acid export membrane protein
VVGQAFYACTLILNDGLLIKKKTYILRNVIIIACFVNVGINLILIPRYGVLGAAQATLISNIFYLIAITYYSFKEFSFKIDYSKILLYCGASLVMYLSIRRVHFSNQLVNLIIEVLVGIVVYSLLILGCDREIRLGSMKVLSIIKIGIAKRFI